MFAGVSLRRRRHGIDRKMGRSTASGVFDQFCPTMRRTGRCPLYEAHVARTEKALAERKAALEQQAATAELLKAVADGDEAPLTEEELEALVNDDQPLPSVELWNECPFLHQRSQVAAQEKDAIVNRMVEFFTLGKVRVTLNRAEVEPDADPADIAASPTVTCDVPTRRGRMIIASRFAARLGAYLGLEDAPPQYTDGVVEDGDDGAGDAAKAVPVTGNAGPTAQASQNIKRVPTVRIRNGQRRRVRLDVPEFRTCAELSLKSVKVCDYLATALERMKKSGLEIDGIILSHNELTDMDPLLNALKRRKLHESLCFIDGSHNELETLRFLFNLRASFGNLVSLRLLNNPITRKPEYREQLRKTLPKLLRLDDESVRRPPLTLPFPRPSTNAQTNDFDGVARFVAALFDSFERDLVDEDFAQRHFHPSVTFSMSVHPDCCFDLPSYAVTPEEQAAREKMSKVESTKGRPRRIKETLLVTAQDAREVQLFSVALKGSTRDLRAGRASFDKYHRGQLPVFQAYVSSLYPPRFPSEHHLHYAQWDVVNFLVPLARQSKKIKYVPQQSAAVRGPAMPAPSTKKKIKAPKLPTGSGGAAAAAEEESDDEEAAAERAARAEEAAARPVFAASAAVNGFEIVTLHGLMSWRVPTMHGEIALRCHYDRTMTLLPKDPVPTDGNEGGDGSSAKADDADGNWADEDDLMDALDKYVLYNDQVNLRPVSFADSQDVHRRNASTTHDVHCLPKRESSLTVFDPRNRPAYARRLAMVFQTDEATVRRAMERSTSDACLHQVLEDLTGSAAGELGVEIIDEEAVVAADEDPMRLKRRRSAAAAATGATPPADGAYVGSSSGGTADELEPILRRRQTEPFVLPDPDADEKQQ